MYSEAYIQREALRGMDHQSSAWMPPYKAIEPAVFTYMLVGARDDLREEMQNAGAKVWSYFKGVEMMQDLEVEVRSALPKKDEIGKRLNEEAFYAVIKRVVVDKFNQAVKYGRDDEPSKDDLKCLLDRMVRLICLIITLRIIFDDRVDRIGMYIGDYTTSAVAEFCVTDFMHQRWQ